MPLMAALAAIGAAAPSNGFAANDDPPALVFAAASMKNALDDIAARWRAETGNAVVISYGGSSTLARQIERGAPADLFVSANEGWMDHLEQGGHVEAASRRPIAANRLVVVSHGKDLPSVDLADPDDLAAKLDGGPLALVEITARIPYHIITRKKFYY